MLRKKAVVISFAFAVILAVCGANIIAGAIRPKISHGNNAEFAVNATPMAGGTDLLGSNRIEASTTFPAPTGAAIPNYTWYGLTETGNGMRQIKTLYEGADNNVTTTWDYDYYGDLIEIQSWAQSAAGGRGNSAGIRAKFKLDASQWDYSNAAIKAYAKTQNGGGNVCHDEGWISTAITAQNITADAWNSVQKDHKHTYYWGATYLTQRDVIFPYPRYSKASSFPAGIQVAHTSQGYKRGDTCTYTITGGDLMSLSREQIISSISLGDYAGQYWNVLNGSASQTQVKDTSPLKYKLEKNPAGTAWVLTIQSDGLRPVTLSIANLPKKITTGSLGTIATALTFVSRADSVEPINTGWSADTTEGATFTVPASQSAYGWAAGTTAFFRLTVAASHKKKTAAELKNQINTVATGGLCSNLTYVEGGTCAWVKITGITSSGAIGVNDAPLDRMNVTLGWYSASQSLGIVTNSIQEMKAEGQVANNTDNPGADNFNTTNATISPVYNRGVKFTVKIPKTLNIGLDVTNGVFIGTGLTTGNNPKPTISGATYSSNNSGGKGTLTSDTNNYILQFEIKLVTKDITLILYNSLNSSIVSVAEEIKWKVSLGDGGGSFDSSLYSFTYATKASQGDSWGGALSLTTQTGDITSGHFVQVTATPKDGVTITGWMVDFPWSTSSKSDGTWSATANYSIVASVTQLTLPLPTAKPTEARLRFLPMTGSSAYTYTLSGEAPNKTVSLNSQTGATTSQQVQQGWQITLPNLPETTGYDTNLLTWVLPGSSTPYNGGSTYTVTGNTPLEFRVSGDNAGNEYDITYSGNSWNFPKDTFRYSISGQTIRLRAPSNTEAVRTKEDGVTEFFNGWSRSSGGTQPAFGQINEGGSTVSCWYILTQGISDHITLVPIWIPLKLEIRYQFDAGMAILNTVLERNSTGVAGSGSGCALGCDRAAGHTTPCVYTTGKSISFNALAIDLSAYPALKNYSFVGYEYKPYGENARMFTGGNLTVGLRSNGVSGYIWGVEDWSFSLQNHNEATVTKYIELKAIFETKKASYSFYINGGQMPTGWTETLNPQFTLALSGPYHVSPGQILNNNVALGNPERAGFTGTWYIAIAPYSSGSQLYEAKYQAGYAIPTMAFKQGENQNTQGATRTEIDADIVFVAIWSPETYGLHWGPEGEIPVPFPGYPGKTWTAVSSWQDRQLTEYEYRGYSFKLQFATPGVNGGYNWVDADGWEIPEGIFISSNSTAGPNATGTFTNLGGSVQYCAVYNQQWGRWLLVYRLEITGHTVTISFMHNSDDGIELGAVGIENWNSNAVGFLDGYWNLAGQYAAVGGLENVSGEQPFIYGSRATAGTLGDKSKVFTAGKEYFLPNGEMMYRPGYTFKGWYLTYNSGADNPETMFTTAITPTGARYIIAGNHDTFCNAATPDDLGTITLYARWTPNKIRAVISNKGDAEMQYPWVDPNATAKLGQQIYMGMAPEYANGIVHLGGIPTRPGFKFENYSYTVFLTNHIALYDTVQQIYTYYKPVYDVVAAINGSNVSYYKTGLASNSFFNGNATNGSTTDPSQAHISPKNGNRSYGLMSSQMTANYITSPTFTPGYALVGETLPGQAPNTASNIELEWIDAGYAVFEKYDANDGMQDEVAYTVDNKRQTGIVLGGSGVTRDIYVRVFRSFVVNNTINQLIVDAKLNGKHTVYNGGNAQTLDFISGLYPTIFESSIPNSQSQWPAWEYGATRNEEITIQFRAEFTPNKYSVYYRHAVNGEPLSSAGPDATAYNQITSGDVEWKAPNMDANLETHTAGTNKKLPTGEDMNLVGHTFMGWYFGTSVNSDNVVRAESNGGQVSGLGVLDGEISRIITKLDGLGSGFENWNDPANNEIPENHDDFYGRITIYALWMPNRLKIVASRNSFNVTGDAFGNGQNKTITTKADNATFLEYDDTVTFADLRETPSISGYSFNGYMYDVEKPIGDGNDNAKGYFARYLLDDEMQNDGMGPTLKYPKGTIKIYERQQNDNGYGVLMWQDVQVDALTPSTQQRKVGAYQLGQSMDTGISGPSDEYIFSGKWVVRLFKKGTQDKGGNYQQSDLRLGTTYGNEADISNRDNIGTGSLIYYVWEESDAAKTIGLANTMTTITAGDVWGGDAGRSMWPANETGFNGPRNAPREGQLNLFAVWSIDIYDVTIDYRIWKNEYQLSGPNATDPMGLSQNIDGKTSTWRHVYNDYNLSGEQFEAESNRRYIYSINDTGIRLNKDYYTTTVGANYWQPTAQGYLGDFIINIGTNIAPKWVVLTRLMSGKITYINPDFMVVGGNQPSDQTLEKTVAESLYIVARMVAQEYQISFYDRLNSYDPATPQDEAVKPLVKLGGGMYSLATPYTITTSEFLFPTLTNATGLIGQWYIYVGAYFDNWTQDNWSGPNRNDPWASAFLVNGRIEIDVTNGDWEAVTGLTQPDWGNKVVFAQWECKTYEINYVDFDRRDVASGGMFVADAIRNGSGVIVSGQDAALSGLQIESSRDGRTLPRGTNVWKPGHTFLGWYWDSTFTKPIYATEDYRLDDDVQTPIYLTGWEGYGYITNADLMPNTWHDDDGLGTLGPEATYEPGHAQEIGYDPNHAEPLHTGEFMLTVYARWQANGVDLKFEKETNDEAEGLVTTVKDAVVGQTIEWNDLGGQQNTTPTRIGYEFKGYSYRGDIALTDHTYYPWPNAFGGFDYWIYKPYSIPMGYSATGNGTGTQIFTSTVDKTAENRVPGHFFSRLVNNVQTYYQLAYQTIDENDVYHWDEKTQNEHFVIINNDIYARYFWAVDEERTVGTENSNESRTISPNWEHITIEQGGYYKTYRNTWPQYGLPNAVPNEADTSVHIKNNMQSTVIWLQNKWESFTYDIEYVHGMREFKLGDETLTGTDVIDGHTVYNGEYWNVPHFANGDIYLKDDGTPFTVEGNTGDVVEIVDREALPQDWGKIGNSFFKHTYDRDSLLPSGALMFRPGYSFVGWYFDRGWAHNMTQRVAWYMISPETGDSMVLTQQQYNDQILAGNGANCFYRLVEYLDGQVTLDENWFESVTDVLANNTTIRLYARWEKNRLRINVDGNGGTLTGTNENDQLDGSIGQSHTQSAVFEYGDEFRAENLGKWEREGHTFDGFEFQAEYINYLDMGESAGANQYVYEGPYKTANAKPINNDGDVNKVNIYEEIFPINANPDYVAYRPTNSEPWRIYQLDPAFKVGFNGTIIEYAAGNRYGKPENMMVTSQDSSLLDDMDYLHFGVVGGAVYTRGMDANIGDTRVKVGNEYIYTTKPNTLVPSTASSFQQFRTKLVVTDKNYSVPETYTDTDGKTTMPVYTFVRDEADGRVQGHYEVSAKKAIYYVADERAASDYITHGTGVNTRVYYIDYPKSFDKIGGVYKYQFAAPTAKYQFGMALQIHEMTKTSVRTIGLENFEDAQKNGTIAPTSPQWPQSVWPVNHANEDGSSSGYYAWLLNIMRVEFDEQFKSIPTVPVNILTKWKQHVWNIDYNHGEYGAPDNWEDAYKISSIAYNEKRNPTYDENPLGNLNVAITDMTGHNHEPQADHVETWQDCVNSKTCTFLTNYYTLPTTGSGPTAMKKPGYTFLGWYYRPTNATAFENWRNYEAKDFTDGTDTTGYDVLDYATAKTGVISAKPPAHAFWTQDGSPEGIDGERYEDDFTITLYAYWVPNSIQIKFDAGIVGKSTEWFEANVDEIPDTEKYYTINTATNDSQGIVTWQELMEGDGYNFKPTRVGYDFAGWSWAMEMQGLSVDMLGNLVAEITMADEPVFVNPWLRENYLRYGIIRREGNGSDYLVSGLRYGVIAWAQDYNPGRERFEGESGVFYTRGGIVYKTFTWEIGTTKVVGMANGDRSITGEWIEGGWPSPYEGEGSKYQELIQMGVNAGWLKKYGDTYAVVITLYAEWTPIVYDVAFNHGEIGTITGKPNNWKPLQREVWIPNPCATLNENNEMECDENCEICAENCMVVTGHDDEEDIDIMEFECTCERGGWANDFYAVEVSSIGGDKFEFSTKHTYDAPTLLPRGELMDVPGRTFMGWTYFVDDAWVKAEIGYLDAQNNLFLELPNDNGAYRKVEYIPGEYVVGDQENIELKAIWLANTLQFEFEPNAWNMKTNPEQEIGTAVDPLYLGMPARTDVFTVGETISFATLLGEKTVDDEIVEEATVPYRRGYTFREFTCAENRTWAIDSFAGEKVIGGFNGDTVITAPWPRSYYPEDAPTAEDLVVTSTIHTWEQVRTEYGPNAAPAVRAPETLLKYINGIPNFIVPLYCEWDVKSYELYVDPTYRDVGGETTWSDAEGQTGYYNAAGEWCLRQNILGNGANGEQFFHTVEDYTMLPIGQNMSKPGYTFLGWYKSPVFTEPNRFKYEWTDAEGDHVLKECIAPNYLPEDSDRIVLYPRWEPNKVEFRFDVNAGHYVIGPNGNPTDVWEVDPTAIMPSNLVADLHTEVSWEKLMGAGTSEIENPTTWRPGGIDRTDAFGRYVPRRAGYTFDGFVYTDYENEPREWKINDMKDVGLENIDNVTIDIGDGLLGKDKGMIAPDWSLPALQSVWPGMYDGEGIGTINVEINGVMHNRPCVYNVQNQPVMYWDLEFRPVVIMTLTATWTANTYQISYQHIDAEKTTGGTNPTNWNTLLPTLPTTHTHEVAQPNKFPSDSQMNKPGYTFLGWYYGNWKFWENDDVNGYWEAPSIKIRTIIVDGEEVEEEYIDGTIIWDGTSNGYGKIPAIPNIGGFSFSNGAVLNVYALWTPNELTIEINAARGNLALLGYQGKKYVDWYGDKSTDREPAPVKNNFKYGYPIYWNDIIGANIPSAAGYSFDGFGYGNYRSYAVSQEAQHQYKWGLYQDRLVADEIDMTQTEYGVSAIPTKSDNGWTRITGIEKQWVKSGWGDTGKDMANFVYAAASARISITPMWKPITYKINLDLQGGAYNGITSMPTPVDHTFGQYSVDAGNITYASTKLPGADQMTRPGSTFGGWYYTVDTNPNSGYRVVDNDGVQDISSRRDYLPALIPYQFLMTETIVYDEVEVTTYTHGEDCACEDKSPETAENCDTRETHTEIVKTETDRYSNLIQPTASYDPQLEMLVYHYNITLYACWIVNLMEISYYADTNGDLLITTMGDKYFYNYAGASQPIQYGTATYIGLNEAGTKDGHTLVGWTTWIKYGGTFRQIELSEWIGKIENTPNNSTIDAWGTWNSGNPDLATGEYSVRDIVNLTTIIVNGDAKILINEGDVELQFRAIWAPNLLRINFATGVGTSYVEYATEIVGDEIRPYYTVKDIPGDAAQDGTRVNSVGPLLYHFYANGSYDPNVSYDDGVVYYDDVTYTGWSQEWDSETDQPSGDPVRSGFRFERTGFDLVGWYVENPLTTNKRFWYDYRGNIGGGIYGAKQQFVRGIEYPNDLGSLSLFNDINGMNGQSSMAVTFIPIWKPQIIDIMIKDADTGKAFTTMDADGKMGKNPDSVKWAYDQELWLPVPYKRGNNFTSWYAGLWTFNGGLSDPEKCRAYYARLHSDTWLEDYGIDTNSTDWTELSQLEKDALAAERLAQYGFHLTCQAGTSGHPVGQTDHNGQNMHQTGLPCIETPDNYTNPYDEENYTVNEKGKKVHYGIRGGTVDSGSGEIIGGEQGIMRSRIQLKADITFDGTVFLADTWYFLDEVLIKVAAGNGTATASGDVAMARRVHDVDTGIFQHYTLLIQDDSGTRDEYGKNAEGAYQGKLYEFYNMLEVTAWEVCLPAKYLQGLSAEGWDGTLFADFTPHVYDIEYYDMRFISTGSTYVCKDHADTCQHEYQRILVNGTPVVRCILYNADPSDPNSKDPSDPLYHGHENPAGGGVLCHGIPWKIGEVSGGVDGNNNPIILPEITNNGSTNGDWVIEIPQTGYWVDFSKSSTYQDFKSNDPGARGYFEGVGSKKHLVYEGNSYDKTFAGSNAYTFGGDWQGQDQIPGRLKYEYNYGEAYNVPTPQISTAEMNRLGWGEDERIVWLEQGYGFGGWHTTPTGYGLLSEKVPLWDETETELMGEEWQTLLGLRPAGNNNYNGTEVFGDASDYHGENDGVIKLYASWTGPAIKITYVEMLPQYFNGVNLWNLVDNPNPSVITSNDWLQWYGTGEWRIRPLGYIVEDKTTKEIRYVENSQRRIYNSSGVVVKTINAYNSANETPLFTFKNWYQIDNNGNWNEGFWGLGNYNSQNLKLAPNWVSSSIRVEYRDTIANGSNVYANSYTRGNDLLKSGAPAVPLTVGTTSQNQTKAYNHANAVYNGGTPTPMYKFAGWQIGRSAGVPAGQAVGTNEMLNLTDPKGNRILTGDTVFTAVWRPNTDPIVAMLNAWAAKSKVNLDGADVNALNAIAAQINAFLAEMQTTTYPRQLQYYMFPANGNSLPQYQIDYDTMWNWYSTFCSALMTRGIVLEITGGNTTVSKELLIEYIEVLIEYMDALQKGVVIPSLVAEASSVTYDALVNFRTEAEKLRTKSNATPNEIDTVCGAIFDYYNARGWVENGRLKRLSASKDVKDMFLRYASIVEEYYPEFTAKYGSIASMRGELNTRVASVKATNSTVTGKAILDWVNGREVDGHHIDGYNDEFVAINVPLTPQIIWVNGARELWKQWDWPQSKPADRERILDVVEKANLLNEYYNMFRTDVFMVNVLTIMGYARNVHQGSAIPTNIALYDDERNIEIWVDYMVNSPTGWEINIATYGDWKGLPESLPADSLSAGRMKARLDYIANEVYTDYLLEAPQPGAIKDAQGLMQAMIDNLGGANGFTNTSNITNQDIRQMLRFANKLNIYDYTYLPVKTFDDSRYNPIAEYGDPVPLWATAETRAQLNGLLQYLQMLKNDGTISDSQGQTHKDIGTRMTQSRLDMADPYTTEQRLQSHVRELNRLASEIGIGDIGNPDIVVGGETSLEWLRKLINLTDILAENMDIVEASFPTLWIPAQLLLAGARFCISDPLATTEDYIDMCERLTDFLTTIGIERDGDGFKAKDNRLYMRYLLDNLEMFADYLEPTAKHGLDSFTVEMVLRPAYEDAMSYFENKNTTVGRIEIVLAGLFNTIGTDRTETDIDGYEGMFPGMNNYNETRTYILAVGGNPNQTELFRKLVADLDRWLQSDSSKAYLDVFDRTTLEDELLLAKHYSTSIDTQTSARDIWKHRRALDTKLHEMNVWDKIYEKPAKNQKDNNMLMIIIIVVASVGGLLAVGGGTMIAIKKKGVGGIKRVKPVKPTPPPTTPNAPTSAPKAPTPAPTTPTPAPTSAPTPTPAPAGAPTPAPAPAPAPKPAPTPTGAPAVAAGSPVPPKPMPAAPGGRPMPTPPGGMPAGAPKPVAPPPPPAGAGSRPIPTPPLPKF